MSEQNISQEEKEQILRNTPVGKPHEQVSDDTLWRRQQRQKLEREQYEEASKEASARLEAQEERQRLIDKNDRESELRRRGWERFPNFGEKYWHEASCPFGCNEQVMYLDKNSPNLLETDSLTIPFSKEHKEGYNYNVFHLCNDLNVVQLRGILNYLTKTIDENRVNQAKKNEELKNYAMWSGMR